MACGHLEDGKYTQGPESLTLEDDLQAKGCKYQTAHCLRVTRCERRTQAKGRTVQFASGTERGYDLLSWKKQTLSHSLHAGR